nr:HOX-like protein 7 [Parasacculina yatsui]
MLNILSKTMAHMSAWSNQQQQQQCKQQQQCDTSAAQQIEESGGSRDVPDGFEDVCQLDDYLATGMSRESYWKMETTRQVLTAVRDHRLDMKLGAKLLGVSYNTIYGRYREAYGSLTESPGSSAAASSAVAVAVANTGGSQKTGDKKLEIVKMNHFVNQGGARMAFWDLPSTKHVLEAIRDKSMELKHAAEVLGVSYGTLYGRYRENYGYLKASWKQQTSGVRKSSSSSGSLWEEPETLELLRRLSVGEVTMDQVAERLSVDYYVLQYQLSLMELTLPFSAQQKVPQSGTKRPAFLQEGPGGKMARIANGLEADDVIGLDDSVEEAQELPQEEDEVDDEELQLKIVEADQLDDPLSHQSSSPHSQLV